VCALAGHNSSYIFHQKNHTDHNFLNPIWLRKVHIFNHRTGPYEVVTHGMKKAYTA